MILLVNTSTRVTVPKTDSVLVSANVGCVTKVAAPTAMAASAVSLIKLSLNL